MRGRRAGSRGRLRAGLVLGMMLALAGCTYNSSTGTWEVDLASVLPERRDLPFVQVSAGYDASCAIINTLALVCWGSHGFGQLGSGEDPDEVSHRGRGPVLPDVPNRASFVDVSVGWHHACAVTDDGSAYCWGSNEHGQLGTRKALDRCSPGVLTVPCAWKPTRVELDHNFVAIAAGGAHTCAITDDGETYCWGSNEWGQLGQGRLEAETRIAPGSHTLGVSLVSVSAGERHTCGLSYWNGVYCWGANDESQVTPRGSGRTYYEPVDVPGSTGFRSVSAGAEHTCGVLRTGGLRCWGRMTGSRDQGPTFGGGPQTGFKEAPTGEGEARPEPLPAMVETGAGGEHACVLDEEGAVWCWGRNQHGQLGSDPDSGGGIPRRMSGYRFSSIDAGYAHTCGITESQELYCWGSDQNRQAGGSFDGRPSKIWFPDG